MGNMCNICAETNPAFTASASSLEANSEKAICLSEKKCSISKVSPSNMRKSIITESVSGSLSFNQLMRASGNLGLEISDLKNPDSALSHFFNTFLDTDQGYKERLIILSSILISGSSAKDKCEILFEIYDLNQNRLLKLSEAKRFAEEAFFVSVDCLPRLALGGAKGIDQGIEEYLKQIRPNEARFVEDVVAGLMGGQPEIGQVRFLEVMGGKLSYVLSSAGIRTHSFAAYSTKTSN